MTGRKKLLLFGLNSTQDDHLKYSHTEEDPTVVER